MGLIKCGCGCGTEFEELDKYNRKRRYVSGHNGRKYNDKWEYQKKWIRENRDKVNGYKKKGRLKRKKKILAELSTGQCIKCGVQYDGTNGAIFIFHHRNPKEKENGIAHMLDYSDKLLLEELSKCDLMCAHCHLILHNGEF